MVYATLSRPLLNYTELVHNFCCLFVVLWPRLGFGFNKQQTQATFTFSTQEKLSGLGGGVVSENISCE